MSSSVNSEPALKGGSEPLTRGTEVARFVVLGLVGRGAMGEVYAAHDPELDRKIAIKLLRGRRGQTSDAHDDGRARLVREAQAIAKVSHPNVVVVYDVGTYDGRVFIAMEFIEGNTLGYWLQAQPRTVGQILDVFASAGRGLAAAHEKDLVHRDFKPENVMVSIDGQVRVMDFGLARLAADRDKMPGEATPMARGPLNLPGLSGRTDEAPAQPVVEIDPMATQILANSAAGRRTTPTGTMTTEPLNWNLTVAGSVVGTPAYMSPEQSRGEASDARTDQFSFCVALYEALYGERPFTGHNLIELAANVIAANIRPEPPGAKVPAWIRRALIRGMNAEPKARFPSMGALLAELKPEAVVAGTRRFAEGAAGKLAGIWESPVGEGGAETDAKVEIRRAFMATGKPYASASFDATSRVLDRFARRWTELYVDACEATHLRGEQSTEVLDLRMAALGEALSDLRALCRELRQATSDTVENAVNAANALGTLERCADVKLLRNIIRPPERPETRAAVEQMQARLSEVRALARLGRVADGLKAVVALERDARSLGYAPLVAEVLFVSGIMHVDVSDIETATRTLEDAVWTADLCRHDEVVAEASASLIFLTGHAQSKFDVGEIWSRHAETVLGRMGGHDLIRGWLFNNRGAMRGTQGRLRDAVDDLHRAIAAKEKALGAEDPDVGISIGNAALYLDELGETAQAAEYTQRAVKIMEAALGADHPRVAIQYGNYAEFLNRLSRFEEAREPAERALTIFERETDPNGVYVTYPLAALAASHLGAGRFTDAVPLLERAVRIRETKESNRAKIAEVHFALGRALWGAGCDRGRAAELVAKARAEYSSMPATPATKRELEDIDHWLAGEGQIPPVAVPGATGREDSAAHSG